MTTSLVPRLVGPLLLAALLISGGEAIPRFARAHGEDSPPTKTTAAPPSGKKPAGAAPVSKVPKPPAYTFRKNHDPNGIGKFYLDREIAHVMGAAAAPWLERSEREQEERLTLLVNLLELKPGLVVADIGAGSGVISVMMAAKVAPGGKVIAVDIQDEMLVLLDKKLKQRNIKNVDLLLGTAKSPKLKPASIDLAIMVDVYHEFEFPHEMLLELSRALKPGGRIAFVEYRKEDRRVPIKLVHKMTQAQVKKEALLPEFRLKWQKTVSKLPQQHLIFFEKLAETEQNGQK